MFSILVEKDSWLLVEVQDFTCSVLVHNRPVCFSKSVNTNFCNTFYLWVAATNKLDIKCTHCNQKMNIKTKKWFGKIALLMCKKEEIRRLSVIQ